MHKLLATLACTTFLAATLPAHALTLVSTSDHGNRAAAERFDLKPHLFQLSGPL